MIHIAWIVFAVVVVCIIGYCAWHHKWRLATKTTADALPARTIEWMDNITEVEASDTIFVGITCYRDTSSLIETLYTLFRTAACAKRVHIGILIHDVGDTEEKVIRQYRTVCHARGSPELAGNISIRCLPTEYAIGPVEARRQLFSSDIDLFHGQGKYVLLVHSHTVFAQNWDTILLKSLPAESEDRRVVVTTVLPQTDAIFGCFTSSADALPTFPCMLPSATDTQSFVPAIRMRTCSGPQSTVAFPVVAACSQLLFARADVFIPIVAGADAYGFFPFFNKNIQDFYLTLQLWSADCELVGPIAHVASHVNIIPISYEIGQRPRSDHGSHRTRRYALMILTTAILVTLAKEQALFAQGDADRWLAVFLKAPYFNVAACGVIPQITAQTEQYIELQIKKAKLPSSVLVRFRKATQAARSSVPRVSGDVYERMRAELSSNVGDSIDEGDEDDDGIDDGIDEGVDEIKDDKDNDNTVDKDHAYHRHRRHRNLRSTYTLARTVKLNPLVTNSFYNPQKSLTSYFDYSGYDWITQQFAGRCIMGLCEDAEHVNIIARYNSRSAYHKERQKWCPV